MIKVIEAQYKEAFRLSLVFLQKDYDSKSEQILHKEVDLAEYLQTKSNYGVFAPLKNVDFFKNFQLGANTIEWANGADIAPERLFEIAK